MRANETSQTHKAVPSWACSGVTSRAVIKASSSWSSSTSVSLRLLRAGASRVESIGPAQDHQLSTPCDGLLEVPGPAPISIKPSSETKSAWTPHCASELEAFLVARGAPLRVAHSWTRRLPAQSTHAIEKLAASQRRTAGSSRPTLVRTIQRRHYAARQSVGAPVQGIFRRSPRLRKRATARSAAARSAGTCGDDARRTPFRRQTELPVREACWCRFASTLARSGAGHYALPGAKPKPR